MNRRKTKVDILKIEGCHKVTSYHFLKKTKKKQMQRCLSGFKQCSCLCFLTKTNSNINFLFNLEGLNK